MRKVGIMTWLFYQNYGTILQAVALSYVIKTLGYDPYEINYRTRSINNKFKWDIITILKKAMEGVNRYVDGEYKTNQKNKLYNTFIYTNMIFTSSCNTEPELQELLYKLDAFVCGSDQIWSPACFDEKYFLSYVNNPSKMISYAPSLGLTHIDNLDIAAQMKKLISRFHYLSVREQQGADLIKRVCNKDAEVVLDPTLLLSSKEWDVFAKQADYDQNKLPGQYIICYFLGDYDRYMKKVKEISNALHIPYFVIPQFKKQAHNKDSVPFDVGPAEFLRLWSNASYAITDSFHGVAFSLNYNIPFTAFKRFRENDPINQNSRVLNILRLMGLEDRLVDEKNFKPDENLIICDFEKANTHLAELKHKSIVFLKDALSEASSAPSIKEPGTVAEISLCCGCGACAAMCPVGAIDIREDNNGFLHNEVDYTKCIRCGKCLQVCPFYHIQACPLKKARNLVAYQSRNEQHLIYSSSGGFSADLAEFLSHEDYQIYGAIYDKNQNQVKHISIKPGKMERLAQIQGSKYLQSHTAESFFKIQGQKSDEKFAFFGTPCQVAALDKMLRLNKRRNEAILVDLICHGVPSQLLWKKYMKEIGDKYSFSSHPEVKFRSENGGWHVRSISITEKGKRYLKQDRKDPFYIFFRNSLCDMLTCYECPYREKSGADIRMGDYWGPRFENNEDGVSMVIGITEEGKKLINLLPGEKEEHPLQEYWEVQVPYNRQRPIFYNELMNQLRNPDVTLAKIREEYAKGFEIRERMGEMKSKVFRLLKRK